MYFDVLISLSLGEYIKALVCDFPVMTTLSVNKGYIIQNNYSLKLKWLVVKIYRAAKPSTLR